MLQVDLETTMHTFHLALRFQAEPGKTTVLLGESGAGKSTVLRLLAGLSRPQKGHVSLADTIYYDSNQRIFIPPQERPFGYVFQDYVLFPHLTVFENVAFGLRAQRLPRHIIKRRVSEALTQVHLTDLDQRWPSQLSGGQQQRVALARALILQPQLLLLDEPLSALDAQTRREVRQELRQILTETHMTTIIVTHQYLDALLFGDQILVLDQGRLIQQGGQRELREAPRSPYIAELVGTNFFQGCITGYESQQTCIIALDNASATIEIIATLKEPHDTAHPTEQTERPAIGTMAYVIVDPRSITLHLTPPDSSARNRFRGRITHLLQQDTGTNGHAGSVRANIQLEGHTTPLTAEITAVSVQRMDLQEGKYIYASFKASEASTYI